MIAWFLFTHCGSHNKCGQRCDVSKLMFHFVCTQAEDWSASVLTIFLFQQIWCILIPYVILDINKKCAKFVLCVWLLVWTELESSPVPQHNSLCPLLILMTISLPEFPTTKSFTSIKFNLSLNANGAISCFLFALIRISILDMFNFIYNRNKHRIGNSIVGGNNFALERWWWWWKWPSTQKKHCVQLNQFDFNKFRSHERTQTI